MPIMPIITAPDRRLKAKSKPLDQVDDSTRALMDDMVETMRAAPGIGLSAVQVGSPIRAIVVGVREADRENNAPEILYLVNPEITIESEDTVLVEEGCLSLPDQFEDVERPNTISLKFLDYDGIPQTMQCGGTTARVIQHEMDHLEGVLFVDHLSKIKRDIILRRLLKVRRQKQTAVA